MRTFDESSEPKTRRPLKPKASADSNTLPPHPILDMQQRYGNQRTQTLYPSDRSDEGRKRAKGRAQKIDSRDIKTEIDGRLRHLAQHVRVAVTSFEEYYQLKTTPKAKTVAPFERQAVGILTTVLAKFLPTPVGAVTTATAKGIETVIDEVQASRLESLNEFKVSMLTRLEQKVTDYEDKMDEVVTEDRVQAGLESLRSEAVGSLSKAEVVDLVTTHYFGVPNRKLDWREILRALIQAYLTHYWNTKSPMEKGIAWSLGWPKAGTFEEAMYQSSAEELEKYKTHIATQRARP